MAWFLLLVGLAWGIERLAERDPRAIMGGIDKNRHRRLFWWGPRWLKIFADWAWLPLAVVAEILLCRQSWDVGLVGIVLILIGWLFWLPRVCNKRLLANRDYQRLALIRSIGRWIAHRENFYDGLRNTPHAERSPFLRSEEVAILLRKSGRENAIDVIEAHKTELGLSSEQIRSVAEREWTDEARQSRIDFVTALADLAYESGARCITQL